MKKNKNKKNTNMEKPWLNFYGDIPEKLDYPDISMYKLIENVSNKYPNNFAYNYFGTKSTYKKFMDDIKKCAKSFLSLGIEKEDVVTICMPNTPEAIISFYAVNMIGAIANMIHPLSGETEIKYYLNKPNSKMLITIDLAWKKAKNIIEETNVKNIVIIKVNDSMPKLLSFGYYLTAGRKVERPKEKEGIMYWNTFLNYGNNFLGKIEYTGTGNDIAAILYSGGTTGDPKGAILSNLNFNASAMQNTLMCGNLNSKDSMLSILPIFHGFGLGVCIHTVLSVGGETILLPKFNAKDFHKLLNNYKPTLIVGVPTLFEALLHDKNMDKVDLSYLKVIISGGDTLTLSVKNKVDAFLKEHNSNIELREGYGQTECVCASCLSPRGKYRENSIGIPYPDTIYKIVKLGTHINVEYNEEGELCICGPTVMKGYLDDIVETNKALQIHEDGNIWLHTGDLACMDQDGYVYFKNRLKRMIISSGYNLYPSYIENVINSHEDVLTSTVIGIEHPYKKQVAKAFIVLKPDVEVTKELKEEIKNHCIKNLPKYSIPYEFEYRDALPKTLIGKVAFTKLMEEEKEMKNESNI